MDRSWTEQEWKGMMTFILAFDPFLVMELNMMRSLHIMRCHFLSFSIPPDLISCTVLSSNSLTKLIELDHVSASPTHSLCRVTNWKSCMEGGRISLSRNSINFCRLSAVLFISVSRNDGCFISPFLLVDVLSHSTQYNDRFLTWRWAFIRRDRFSSPQCSRNLDVPSTCSYITLAVIICT